MIKTFDDISLLKNEYSVIFKNGKEIEIFTIHKIVDSNIQLIHANLTPKEPFPVDKLISENWWLLKKIDNIY